MNIEINIHKVVSIMIVALIFIQQIPFSVVNAKAAGVQAAYRILYYTDPFAWELEAYREDGSIEKTSGKLGYIYGDRVLETIVSLLPQDGNHYDSSAFISINRASDTTKNTTE